ncbi:MAG: hypothetical protein FJZ00_12820, partial [Candidatus Sericytochromatia bacterium]|nr:hypothetical protein [Candidatus Tanganyikabacteria bacterium]
GYTGWYAWPDLAVGTTGGIQGGITVGGGPLAGFALFHRVADPFGYSISLELGAGPFAGFRYNNGSLNVPTSSTSDAPTTLAELGVSGAAPGFAAPFGGHLMGKFILSLEFFSRPNNSNHLDVTIYSLPGGIHDNPQSYFKAALAAGIGFGSSWK